MTRKRYVKLMMACGYDRNESNMAARIDAPCFGSYLRAAHHMKTYFRCMTWSPSPKEMSRHWDRALEIMSGIPPLRPVQTYSPYDIRKEGDST